MPECPGAESIPYASKHLIFTDRRGPFPHCTHPKVWALGRQWDHIVRGLLVWMSLEHCSHCFVRIPTIADHLDPHLIHSFEYLGHRALGTLEESPAAFE